VVLFDTAARLAGDDGAVWEAPIHGWVYEPADSRVRKSALAALLKAQFGLEASEATRANFDRRVNLFLADNERDKQITVQVAGREVVLPKSGPNGHFESDVSITPDPARQTSDTSQRMSISRRRAASRW
jgi:hypothetical protein